MLWTKKGRTNRRVDYYMPPFGGIKMSCTAHVYLRHVTLEADVGAVGFGRHVDGDVLAVWQQTVHGVAARIKQEVVDLRSRDDLVDPRLLQVPGGWGNVTIIVE